MSSVSREMDVVVSDYGSKDAEGIRKAVLNAGGRVVRTECSGPWSRSRALNAGIVQTDSPYVITTDSDVIFSPLAIEKILHLLETDAKTINLVQCRDLHDHFDIEHVTAMNPAELEDSSLLRPRWGMGGLIAFRRESYELIGGYDERMEIYGGEDIDFAQRLVRSGLRLNWIDDQEVRIYHIWHPPTRNNADTVQLEAVNKNSDMVQNDKSFVRNLTTWTRVKPLASVLIATRNRGGFLLDSINSTLAQTVQDIEIIVMDDGSDDETQDILASVTDRRVRKMRQGLLGVSIARNKLVAAACAPFIVVHDDDDIMLPWRIEAHFKVLTEEVAGTYGGWVDFNNETGETNIAPGKEYDARAFFYTGTIMSHGTAMFRTEVLKRYPYREYLPAGVDYNLIARLTHAGYILRHTNELHILRRMHTKNMTFRAQGAQRMSGQRIVQILRKRNSPVAENTLREKARKLPEVQCRNAGELQEKILPFLPDHLTQRSVSIDNITGDLHQRLKKLFSIATMHASGWSDNPSSCSLTLWGLTLADLALLRSMKVDFTVSTVLPKDECTKPDDAMKIVVDLPSSGLLDEKAITIVSVAPVDDAPAIGEGEAGNPVRTRTWTSGSATYGVSAVSVSQDMVPATVDACNTEQMLLVIPLQIAQLSKGGRLC